MQYVNSVYPKNILKSSMQSLEERLIHFSFFFFINTKSGNKQGTRILSLSK